MTARERFPLNKTMCMKLCDNIIIKRKVVGYMYGAFLKSYFEFDSYKDACPRLCVRNHEFRDPEKGEGCDVALLADEDGNIMTAFYDDSNWYVEEEVEE